MAAARQLRRIERRECASVAGLRGSSNTHLALPIRLATGLAVDVDPLTPGQWQAITVVRRGEDTEALLVGLVGRTTARRMLETATSTEPVAQEPIALTGKLDGDEWLRIAAVDALDRWLQIPLNASVVRTERAVVRAETAATIEDGPVRSALLADALTLALTAQPGFEEFLSQLELALPAPLLYGVRHLVKGVLSLADMVPDAQDLRTISVAGERVLRARRTSDDGRILRRP